MVIVGKILPAGRCDYFLKGSPVVFFFFLFFVMILLFLLHYFMFCALNLCNLLLRIQKKGRRRGELGRRNEGIKEGCRKNNKMPNFAFQCAFSRFSIFAGLAEKARKCRGRLRTQLQGWPQHFAMCRVRAVQQPRTPTFRQASPQYQN